MPKNDKQTGAAGSRADQVRSAVEGAFQVAGAQIGRDRALDLADELASAAQRVREALEELRPPSADDLKRIDQRLSAIERRLKALEGSTTMTAPPRSAAKPATRAAAKSKPAGAAAKKTKPKPAARAAAKPKPATRAAAKRKPAAARPKAARPSA